MFNCTQGNAHFLVFAENVLVKLIELSTADLD
jgi:hypothetical protein